MTIYEFINSYDENKHFLNNWGCYIFARMLQVNFWWVIYSNIQHCKLKLKGWYFDINWEIWHRQAIEEGYWNIDECEETRYKNYENFT